MNILLSFVVMSKIETPEILVIISSFLRADDCARCCRVSRTWHNVFIPHVWRSINSQVIENPARHSDLVNALVLLKKVPAEYSRIDFPALSSLRISRFSFRTPGLMGLLKRCASTLVHVELLFVLSVDLPFWEELEKLSNLKELTMLYTSVPKGCFKTFMRICARLESLSLNSVNIDDFAVRTFSATTSLPRLIPTTPNPLLPSEQSLAMRQLSLTSVIGMTAWDQLLWITKFPGITHLSWDCTEAYQHAKDFSTYLGRGLWPDLNSLSLKGTQIPDDILFDALNHINQIKRFYASETGFDLGSLKALEPSFGSSLEVLDVRGCRNMDKNRMGILAQRILESCGKLREFKCGMVPARFFLKEGPWIGCANSLRSLKIEFDFEPNGPTGSNDADALTLEQITINGKDDTDEIGPEDLHKFIFGRLSIFTRLQDADFGTETLQSIQGLDFRLSHGMGQLATLRQLNRLELGNTLQCIDIDEIVWIMMHWQVLENFQVKLNMDKALCKRLSRILGVHGTKVYL